MHLLTALALSLTQAPPQVELERVTVRRNDRGQLEAVLTLKQDLPSNFKKITVRLVFVQEGSGLAPKAVSDIPAPADMTMRAGLGWSYAGGTIVHRDKPVGFLIDVRPFDKWKTTDPKTITVPLTSTTLADRQHLRMLQDKGDLLVALVKAATIDDTRIPVSNTVSTKVNDTAP